MGEDPSHHRAESESDVLLFFLGRVRESVIRASAGLTSQQERTPDVPSGTSLLGLIQHLTAVEEHWFQRVFLGEDRDTDMSMDVPPDATRDVRCGRADRAYSGVMTLTVQLPRELAAALEAEAARRGQTPDQTAADLLAERLSLPGARRRLAFVGIGSSTTGRNAADADEMLAEGFGRDS